jgi:bacillithiol system protein YtxJ
MTFTELTEQNIDKALQNGTIFKHSDTCGISMGRKEAIENWLTQHDKTIYIVEVKSQRGLSNKIQQETGIKHESPQLLIQRDGETILHKSHGAIKPSILEQA